MRGRVGKHDTHCANIAGRGRGGVGLSHACARRLHLLQACPGSLSTKAAACLAEDLGKEAALGDAAPPALRLEAELALQRSTQQARTRAVSGWRAKVHAKVHALCMLHFERNFGRMCSRCSRPQACAACWRGCTLCCPQLPSAPVSAGTPITCDSPFATGGSWWKSPDRMSCRQRHGAFKGCWPAAADA